MFFSFFFFFLVCVVEKYQLTRVAKYSGLMTHLIIGSQPEIHHDGSFTLEIGKHHQKSGILFSFSWKAGLPAHHCIKHTYRNMHRSLVYSWTFTNPAHWDQEIHHELQLQFMPCALPGPTPCQLSHCLDICHYKLAFLGVDLYMFGIIQNVLFWSGFFGSIFCHEIQWQYAYNYISLSLITVCIRTYWNV